MDGHSFRFCPLCAQRLAPLPDGPDRGRMACADCDFVHYDNPAVTSMAFVEREGRYLLLRRRQMPHEGEWDLPGGFMESGETPRDCVLREVAEETALTLYDLTELGAFTSRYGEGRWTVDIAWHARAHDGEVTLSEEKSDHVWVSLNEFPKLAFAGERHALEALRRLVPIDSGLSGREAA